MAQLGKYAVVGLSAFVLLTGAATSPRARSADAPTAARTFVYWDQNEEQDFTVDPSGPFGVLIPPWDPNGQMCIFPDGSGRFVTGYHPTLTCD